MVSGAGTGFAAAAKIGAGVGFVDVVAATVMGVRVGVGLAMGVALFVKGEATGEVLLLVVVELPPTGTYIFPFRIPWLDPE